MEGRKRRYLLLMGTCLVLCALAWIVGAQWSPAVGIAVAAVAALLPPVAVVIANLGWQARARAPRP